MNRILPIGSVVQLKNGEQKIMIINRGALFNNEGNIGYFDYSACLYPYGQSDQNVLFFNDEDVEVVHFEGYKDDAEVDFCIMYHEKIKNIHYPKFKIDNNV